MNDYGDYVLGAAGSGGQYFPSTDSMAFDYSIPDEFPYLEFSSIRESDIGPLAAVIEEFVHRFQFGTTHFGILYRLACMIQVQKVLELLAWIGGSSKRHLPIPWLTAESTDKTMRGTIDDLRTLEDAKRFLFGSSLNGRDVLTQSFNCFARLKELVESYSPLRLGHFSTFGGFEKFYDGSGRVKITETTRAVVESHASAFAFELLRRHAPRGLESAIDEFIKKNRRGLYRTVEAIAQALDQPLSIDLEAVLRLGDFALDGKLVDIRTIPPPEDYVEAALPYVRYHGSLERLESMHKAGRRLGYELSQAQQIEAVIFAQGDDRGVIETDAVLGRRIQLRKETDYVTSWLEEEEKKSALPDLAIVMRREIARSSLRFLQGVLSFAPDARKFNPSVPGLVTLCQICDLPSIEYPFGFEVFRCEPQEVDRHFLAFRGCVHSVATIAMRLLSADLPAVYNWSKRLESLGLPGLSGLAASLGFKLSQLS